VFTEQKAWDAVYAAIDDIEALPEDTLSQVISITVVGSLVRGDFIEDNSDVDICTLLKREAGVAWKSYVNSDCGRIFDRHFAPCKAYTGNPYVWDNLIIGEDDLPTTSEEAAQHQFKAFSIYLFDLIANHRTVYGEDFTTGLPRIAEPRSLVLPRLERLLGRAEDVFKNEPNNHFRIYMFAIEALKAVQLYFSQVPSIHKDRIIDGYICNVPEFPMKQFGIEIWRDYVETRYPDDVKPHKPLSECVEYLGQIRDVVQAVEKTQL
jgi:hypothetical protein